MSRELAPDANTFAVQVGSTEPVQVVKSNPRRKALLLYNNGSATIYLLSAQNKRATDGIPIPTNSAYQNDDCYGPYWAIAASGTQDLRVEEDGE